MDATRAKPSETERTQANLLHVWSERRRAGCLAAPTDKLSPRALDLWMRPERNRAKPSEHKRTSFTSGQNVVVRDVWQHPRTSSRRARLTYGCDPSETERNRANTSEPPSRLVRTSSCGMFGSTHGQALAARA